MALKIGLALGLTDAKQKALHRLGGVLPDFSGRRTVVEQDEQELVCRLNQMRFAASATVASLVDDLAFVETV